MTPAEAAAMSTQLAPQEQSEQESAGPPGDNLYPWKRWVDVSGFSAPV